MDKLKKIIYPIIVLVQVILWCGVISVQYLTNKKAGVMHHVYFKKYEYSNSISNEMLYILTIISLIIAFIFLLWFIYSIKSSKNKFYIVQTIITIFMTIFLSIVININFFKSLLSYYYFIMIASIVLLIQVLWDIVLFIKYK